MTHPVRGGETLALWRLNEPAPAASSVLDNIAPFISPDVAGVYDLIVVGSLASAPGIPAGGTAIEFLGGYASAPISEAMRETFCDFNYTTGESAEAPHVSQEVFPSPGVGTSIEFWLKHSGAGSFPQTIAYFGGDGSTTNQHILCSLTVNADGSMAWSFQHGGANWAGALATITTVPGFVLFDGSFHHYGIRRLGLSNHADETKIGTILRFYRNGVFVDMARDPVGDPGYPLFGPGDHTPTPDTGFPIGGSDGVVILGAGYGGSDPLDATLDDVRVSNTGYNAPRFLESYTAGATAPAVPSPPGQRLLSAVLSTTRFHMRRAMIRLFGGSTSAPPEMRAVVAVLLGSVLRVWFTDEIDPASGTEAYVDEDDAIIASVAIGDRYIDYTLAEIPAAGVHTFATPPGEIVSTAGAAAEALELEFEGVDPADVVAPVIGGIIPPAGFPLERTMPVQFDLIDDSGGLLRAIIAARFPALGSMEVVHDGTAFGPQYEGERTAIDGGWRYTGVLRRGGWPAAPTLITYAIDAAGNESA